GGATNFSGRPLYFYSRRIGREPQGKRASSGDFEDMPTSTTILGAAKLSGRPAGGWSVGVLDALTARERATVFDATARTYARDEVEPPTNYFAGRVRRDLDAGNTSFGLLATAMDRWPDSPRSEERRVGKEWRTWAGWYQYNKMHSRRCFAWNSMIKT